MVRSKSKSPPNKATKKSSPKAAAARAKAAANTKSLFHYFSPSPSKKNSTQIHNKGKSDSKIDIEAQIKVVEPTSSPPANAKQPSRTRTHLSSKVTKTNARSPAKKTPLKRKNPLALTPLNKNLMETRESQSMCAGTSVSKDTAAKKRKAIHKNSSTSATAPQRNSQTSKSSSLKSESTSKSLAARVKAIVDPPATSIQDSCAPSRSNNMALIRVQNSSTNLKELCQHLCILSSRSSQVKTSDGGLDVYQLHENSMLGRNEPKVKENKVSLGIPKDESGVSRGQVIVTEVNYPTTSDEKKIHIDAIKSINDDEESSLCHSDLCRYMQDVQRYSSTVTICNKGNNSVLVSKARIKVDSEGGEILMGHISRLNHGKSMILKGKRGLVAIIFIVILRSAVLINIYTCPIISNYFTI